MEAKEHMMSLQEPYFGYIKNGEKTVEGRLNDEKRKNINVGDIIIFRSNVDDTSLSNALFWKRESLIILTIL